MNIFEQSSRFQFRFESIRGLLNIEQLWSRPVGRLTLLLFPS